MNDLFLKEILKSLQPKTLAYIARDLKDQQDDWCYYPAEAQSARVQQALGQFLEVVTIVGTEAAASEGLDFSQLLSQANEEQQQQDDWRWQRNQQVRQNWTGDLE
jgi:hypothetical protein